MEKTDGLVQKKPAVKRQVKRPMRLIFSRTSFILLFVLIQIGYFFSLVEWLSKYSLYAYAVFDLLGAFLCIFIINKRENPSFKLSWIIPILMFPIFGALLYLYVELEISGRLIAKKEAGFVRDTACYMTQDRAVLKRLEQEDRQMAGLARYVGEKGGFPVYDNTSVLYFKSGQEKFERLKEELLKAEHYIFLEYFIVERGVMWDGILEILEQKAKEGVEVRFLYDGMGCLNLLPHDYPKQLRKKGILCYDFGPVRPFLSTFQNNRDHRKIVVIDGHTAFTGGINLADEYINVKERFGYWKDVAVMLKGDAVRNFTVMFLQMWNIWEKKPVDCERYLMVREQPARGTYPGQGDTSGYVLAYGDSPLDHEAVGKRVYIDILFDAKDYVHIMTPYLILDDETISAMIYAAKRGVEVIIIMPHIPDKKYAFVLAHTYYEELLDAGVRIFEFTPGFVHAKTFTSDGEKAVVGTINLDFRSLYHHFECAALIYRNPVVADIEADFQETLAQCQEITMETCRRYPLRQKIAGGAMRLIAPLM